jgi:hypothetical protein
MPQISRGSRHSRMVANSRHHGQSDIDVDSSVVQMNDSGIGPEDSTPIRLDDQINLGFENNNEEEMDSQPSQVFNSCSCKFNRTFVD